LRLSDSGRSSGECLFRSSALDHNKNARLPAKLLNAPSGVPAALDALPHVE